MSQQKSSSVHRYFELADSFVEVRVLHGEVLELQAPRRLDRTTYRRLVIQTCIPEFAGDVSDHLENLFPDDPMLAEDLLYQLCIDVNPQLEIHRVRLRASGTRDEQRDKSAPAVEAATEIEFLQRLAHTSRRIESRLKRHVVGQDEAVGRVSRAVMKAAAGLGSQGRPLGAFLFVGRTGTGKTELARALARTVFGEESAANGAPSRLVRIDCSEFSLPHEYSKLIGSPPGYVGHDEGGVLTEALSRARESIVLFDEVEKAHPRLHNLLLQILEEGSLTDGKGRQVSFDRSFVVLTSNVGAEDVVTASSSLGFHREPSLGQPTLDSITQTAIERTFPPELLGRLGEVVVFNELGRVEARRIAQTQLTDLAVRARRRGTRVAFTPAVAGWVAEQGFSPEYGARELRHVIEREIEPMLAELILQAPPNDDSLLRARIQCGRPAISREA